LAAGSISRLGWGARQRVRCAMNNRPVLPLNLRSSILSCVSALAILPDGRI
jgi:hypothetical protein